MIKSAPTTKKQKETHNTKHHFIQQQHSFDLRPHDIYSHAGAGHEDQFITDCGIDPSRIVNTCNMLAQIFPNLSPSATGKNQGTFLNASLFWTSFFLKIIFH